MQCPIDQATLLITERRGIEVDYCPECRGVWLDRGELDKLLTGESKYYDDDDDTRRGSPGARAAAAPQKKRKKTSFLTEIFESIGGGE